MACYNLKTIKPAAYPAGAAMRPSHIHFEVWGKRERLVTQLYFKGDPFHDKDRFLLSAERPETIVMPILEPLAGMDADAKRVVFDIVLMQGYQQPALARGLDGVPLARTGGGPRGVGGHAGCAALVLGHRRWR